MEERGRGGERGERGGGGKGVSLVPRPAFFAGRWKKAGLGTRLGRG